MKQTIKSILAFAALMLCGGAWAANTLACWNGDFVNGENRNGFVTTLRSSDANAVSFQDNGTVKLTGTSSVASEGLQILVPKNGIGTHQVSILVKYSGYSSGAYNSLLSTVWKGANVTVYATGNGEKVGAAHSVTTTSGGTQGTPETYSGNVPTEGMMLVEFSGTNAPKGAKVSFARKNGDTYTDFTQAIYWSGVTYSDSEFTKFMVGGTVGPTGSYYRPSMTIEGVAIFDDHVSYADAKSFAWQPTDEREYAKVIALNFNAGEGSNAAGNLSANKLADKEDGGIPGIKIPGAGWNQTDVANPGSDAVTLKVYDTETGADVEVDTAPTATWSCRNHWQSGCSSHSCLGCAHILRGYLDDTNPTTVTINNIPFEKYDAILVYSTDDTNNNTWGYVDANGTTYTYSNGSLVSGATTAWGYHHNMVVQYGVNAMRIPNLTTTADDKTLTLKAYKGGRACIAAVVIVESTQSWTGAAGDGNWDTAGNWKHGTVPSADDDVIIAKAATISLSSTSTAKSIKIMSDVTFTGAVTDGKVNNVTIADGKTLTVNYTNTAAEGGIRNVVGGTLVKTGGGVLRLANANGSAVNGTTVKIDQGTIIVHNSGGGDAVMTDPTFVIGANGTLTNYGWFTANGTLTIENETNKEAFLSGAGLRALTKFVKKGAGNLTLRAWKANSGDKVAFDNTFDIQAGRLTFFPHGAEYTVSGVISGAGGVGVVQGSAAGNWVKISGNNTYSGGTVIESGTLGLGHKNALGGQGKTLLVESGATFDVRGTVDHGTVTTLHGGTIKNSTGNCGLGSVQFRSIELTADSTADLAYATGILNNNYNATSIKLNGHKLTKKGSAALYLVSVTTANAGTLRLEAGSIHFMGGNNEYPANKAPATSQMTLEVAGANVGLPGNYALTFANVTVESDASLAAGTAAMTVNGTLKVAGSIAKATTVASTGTLDLSAVEGTSAAEKITGNLTINSGVAFKFPAGHTGAAYTLCGGTLTAPASCAGLVTVGDADPIPVTLAFDTTAKTVSYATALTEYALSEADVTAINNADLAYGGAAIVQTSATSDIAKSCTFTNVPDGYTVYGLGNRQIGVVKMNYEDAMEAKLNAAALHFDVSRLNTIAAGQDNAVTGLDNLGSDTTRTMAALNGNGNSANVSPILTASKTGIYLDFGDGGSHKDLGWQRLENIKTVIQVVDLVHDGNKGFFLGDWNNGSGTFGFHRGDGAQYLNTQHAKADYVYDNGVSKQRGADCPTGMRVLSMGETGSDNIGSDCFSHDRNQGTRNGGRKLCETVIFTTALSDSERVEIEDYLLRKWFNAEAVLNGVPKATLDEALTEAAGDYAGIHTLVNVPAEKIPEGWLWQNGTFYPIIAKVGQRSYASIEDAVASLQEGETIVEVVVKATSFVKAPADAAYTIKYTAGAGSDSEDGSAGVALDHSAGKITLAGSTPYYLKGEWATYGNPTITFDGATVYYKGTGDNGTFGVSTATYVIQGDSRVEANRFILSQGGASRTANVTIKDSAVVTITGNNDNHSNQATVMIGHWNGPSTLTIQDSAKLVVPNAGIHIGQTGNTQIINLNGGTLEAKGITMADYSATSTLNLAGGTLKLGEMGIDKYASKVLTISMTADTTIEATAATFPLEQAISVPTDKTLTFTSSTLTTLDISTITLATGAALNLSGCTALVSVPVGMKEAVASVPFSQITMPSGAAYAVTPTKSEYANGSLVVENVPEGVNLKVQLPGDEGLGEMTREGTTLTYKGDVKISGYATSFDDTFVHFEDHRDPDPGLNAYSGTLDYKEISGANMQYDHNPEFVGYETDGEGNKVATKNTGVKMKAHPYIQGLADSWWQGTRQLTLAVVGTMPTDKKTIFIHMGHSYTDRTGLMIATGDKDDEVVIAWNSATTIHEITRLSVPNAATARHVYIVTKNDDVEADTTTFTVYLDGMKWKTLEVTPLFTITGGVQVGSDFGGYIREAGEYSAANGETGIVNAIRLYGRVISDAEIAQYSVEAEFPYHSPKGSSARTFEAGASNWVETESTPWSNLAKDATVAVASGSALDGSSIEATLSGAAEITVNVAEAGVAYEALNVKGSGTASFVTGTGSGAIRITGVATIGNAITTKPGALDLSTALITLAGDGAITFDYSEFEPSNELATQVIPLTGDMEQADDKVLVTLPASHPNHTMVKAYNTSLKKYELTVTMTNKVLDIPSKDNTTPTATVQVGEGEAQTVEIVNGQITAPVGSTVVVTYTPNTGYFADENGVVTIESVGATSTVTAPEMPTLVKGQASVIAYESEEDMEGTKTYYKTLAQAVDAYEDGNDLMLETDVIVTETFTFAKSVSLAPNNFTISSANADVPAVKVSAATTVILVGQGGVANTASGIAVDVAGDLISVYSAITGRVVLDWDPSKDVDDQPTVSVNPSTILVDGKPLVKEYNDTLYRVTLMSGETTFSGITMMGYAVVSIDEEEPAKPTDDEPTVIDDPEEKVAMEPDATVIVPIDMPIENIKVVYNGVELSKVVEGESGHPKYVAVSINETTGAVELTTTDSAKPAATAIAMATPTEEGTDKVQFTITNPIPGLFYAVSSCDEPNGDFTSATGDQATSDAAKTVSIPMTFTDGKKVKYYKVSVKATK